MSDRRSRVARLLAAAEYLHSLVSRRLIAEFGFSRNECDSLVQSASLEQMMAGVHRVVGSARTFEQVSLAPVLAAGREARLCGVGAARLWRLTERFPRSIEVMIPYRSTTRSGTMVAPTTWSAKTIEYSMRRSQRLDAIDRIVVDNIPTTSVSRTLIDLAGDFHIDELESMFEVGRRSGLVTVGHLAARIESLGGSGTPGTAKIRELIARQSGLAKNDSELETRLWQLLQRRSFATNDPPTRQFETFRADGRPARIDVAWGGRRYGVEGEGWEWHEGRGRWKRDKRRTASLEAAGWRLTFVTWDDVVRHPVETLDRIARAYETCPPFVE